jgi:hypothetical protein
MPCSLGNTHLAVANKSKAGGLNQRFLRETLNKAKYFKLPFVVTGK